jgi:hypothetical protein
MKLHRFALVAMLAIGFAGVALATARYVELERRLTPEQLHATGLDTLRAEQLARLNELRRADAEQQAARAPAARPAEERGAADFIGMDAERIQTRVQGSVSGWEPGTEFRLANGQVWKVLKGSMKLRKPLESPEVVLVPGVMGRWFLQVDEDLPKARVYRVD